MRTYFLGLVLLAVYALFGRYYYFCELKQDCGEAVVSVAEPTPERGPTLNLTYGDSILLADDEVFFFPKDGINPVYSNNNLAFLRLVSSHLKSNPEQKLLITIQIAESEKAAPSGAYPNLGVARADRVQTQLENYGVPPRQISYEVEDVENADQPIKFEITQ